MERLCLALRNSSQSDINSSSTASSLQNDQERLKKFTEKDRKEIFNEYDIGKNTNILNTNDKLKTNELQDDIDHSILLDKIDSRNNQPQEPNTSGALQTKNRLAIRGEAGSNGSNIDVEETVKIVDSKSISRLSSIPSDLKIPLTKESVRDQSMQIDNNKGDVEVPPGWKVSRYRGYSSPKLSSSSGTSLYYYY